MTLAEDCVDVVVIGEGEETLLDLYRAVTRAGGEALDDVPGIHFKDGRGGTRRTSPRPNPDIETLPFAYQGRAEALLALYLDRESIREAVGYETSRGCPFLCAFCYSPNFHDRTRVKSPEKVGRELEALGRLGVEDIDIYDDTLFGGREASFPDLLGALRQSKMTWIGNLRINMLTDDLMRGLESSGCRWLYFGIESNDDRVLRRLRKGFKAADIVRGVEIMRRSRIPAVYSILYGLPLDDVPTDLGPFLEFAMELHSKHPEAEIQVQSFVPLPGTELFADAVRRGFSPPTQLSGWVRHDHFGVTEQWLAEPALANKVYLSTFLAFRYRRHLSSLPIALAAFPLHKLNLWRIRHRFFQLYFELFLYEAYLGASEVWTGSRFWLRDRRPAPIEPCAG